MKELDNKGFKKAVWETRKKYGRQFLTKKQLGEAFLLYKAAQGNRQKFQELLKDMFIMRHER